MYNYRTLSKSQLIELVNGIESTLSNSIYTAEKEAKEYSTELPSQLAFEVGYFKGYVTTVLSLIEEYKNCSK